MSEYKELDDLDDEETQMIKRRIERGKQRGNDIIHQRLKDNRNYSKPKLGCFTKLRHDFSSYINFKYSFTKNGNHFMFLLLVFLITFTFVSFMLMHHMYNMLMIPTMILFLYHFIQSLRKVNLYLGVFFFVQFGLQVTMLFYDDHMVAFGISSLIFTCIHLFASANLLDLRFYLRVCLLLGVLYIGIGLKDIQRYRFYDYYFFYFLIFLALVNVFINKFCLFQLVVFWIPQSIKLFFISTCCKPKIQFDFKSIYLFNKKYILKGLSSYMVRFQDL